MCYGCACCQTQNLRTTCFPLIHLRTLFTSSYHELEICSIIPQVGEVNIQPVANGRLSFLVHTIDWSSKKHLFPHPIYYKASKLRVVSLYSTNHNVHLSHYA